MGEKRHWNGDGTPKALGSARYRRIVPGHIQAMDYKSDTPPSDWYVEGGEAPPVVNYKIEHLLSRNGDGKPSTARNLGSTSIEGAA
jgi:hypothetical protein